MVVFNFFRIWEAGFNIFIEEKNEVCRENKVGSSNLYFVYSNCIGERGVMVLVGGVIDSY